MFGARTRKAAHATIVDEGGSSRQRKPDGKAGADDVEIPPHLTTCHSHAVLDHSMGSPGAALVNAIRGGSQSAEGQPTPRSFRNFTVRRLLPLAAALAFLFCVFGARGAPSTAPPTARPYVRWLTMPKWRVPAMPRRFSVWPCRPPPAPYSPPNR